MAKVMRKPIVDINGKDLRTGEYIGDQPLDKQTIDHFKRTKKQFESKEKNSKGEVYVEGLGRVK